MYEDHYAGNPSEDFLEQFFDVLLEEPVEVLDFDIRNVLERRFVKFPRCAHDVRMEHFPVLGKHEATAFEMHGRQERPGIRIADVRDDQNPLFLHEGAEFRDMRGQSGIAALGLAGSAGIAVVGRLLLETRTSAMRATSGSAIENI